ncbi:MAG: hypothetical protein WDO70_07500 [Alphaproteobacteria bacterium]
MNRAEIAAKIFRVAFDKLPGGDPRADHDAVAALGNCFLPLFLNGDQDILAPSRDIWANWLQQAEEANVVLPYQTPQERFSGKFPSYLESEAQIIEHILFAPLQGFKPDAQPVLLDTMGLPVLLDTLGPPGGEKSTLLRRIQAAELPHSILSDPDEGVLENLGPYRLARAVKKLDEGRRGLEKLQGLPPAKYIGIRNLWREPPYNTFRAASNATNTQVTGKAVAEGQSVAFGWTGIKGYGLDVLIKQGYIPAGYRQDSLVTFADLETSQTLEGYRERPASPVDFVNKRIDYILALPETLPIADRARLFAVRLNQEPLLAATLNPKLGIRDTVPDGVQAIRKILEKEQTRLDQTKDERAGKFASIRAWLETEAFGPSLPGRSLSRPDPKPTP